MTGEEFFQIVDARNTAPDGTEFDPTLRRRLNHPRCLECQARYKQKYPNRPFNIICDGIYSDLDFEELSEATGLDIHQIRECYDIPYWAENHVKLTNAEGDLVPFKARDCQEWSLKCTSQRQVNRWARGLGKTQRSVIKEIHTCVTRKRWVTVVICPQKHQAETWYQEIEKILNTDRALSRTVVHKRQAPFYQFTFSNESVLRIFTAGSKSGRGADSVRSQSPRKLTLDECDLLNGKDFAAITPLMRRFPDMQVEASSTPLGKREDFWEMCTQRDDYQELYFPIQAHPDFGVGSMTEEKLREEARTEERWVHEWLAEFGDLATGVFKSVYVDAARTPYKYSDCVYDSEMRYYMGVDWNGEGNGTKIRICEYNPRTQKRRFVDLLTITTSQTDSMQAVIDMNRKWRCEGIFIDAGFGAMQGEMIRKFGADSKDPRDKNLVNTKSIDFGGTLTFNKLVSKRGTTRFLATEELDRRTKPFMVEGAVMAFEGGYVEFSDKDKILDEQLRAYHVENYSSHGWANTYKSDVGDHDLDAAMLALLGIELRYGITYRPPIVSNTAGNMALVAGFGSAQVRGTLEDSNKIRARMAREAGVPSREVPAPPAEEQLTRLQIKQRWIQNGGGYFAVPNRPSLQRTTARGVHSRTQMFQQPEAPSGARDFRRFPLR